jgi:hypothetical protein
MCEDSTPDVTDDEQYVIDRLTGFGISARKIQRSPARKTYDLLARDDAAQYAIEVKRRRSDEAIHDALQRNRATGWVTRPMGFSASTEKTMRHAVKQLDAIASADAFKLIWYYIDPQYRDEDTLVQQVYDTAFGGANLIKMSKPGEAVPIHCLFFHRSVFFTHPQLSGIVIDTCRRFTLLLSPFGARTWEVRATPLFLWFDAEQGGVVDADRLHTEGLVLIADCAIDRRDEHAVLTYLKRKYGLSRWGLLHLPLRHHSNFISVPADLLQPGI